jgi:glycosyltransferase involved in cell wall biosynthesis
MISDDFRMQGFLYHYFVQLGPHTSTTWSQVDPCLWNVGEHLKKQCMHELCTGQSVLFHGVVQPCVRSLLSAKSSAVTTALTVGSEAASRRPTFSLDAGSMYEAQGQSGNCERRDIHVVYGASVEVLDLLKASVASIAANTVDPCRVQVHVFIPSQDVTTIRRTLFSDLFVAPDALRRVPMALHAIDFNASRCIQGLVPEFIHKKRLETPMNHIRADLACFFREASVPFGGAEGISLPQEKDSVLYLDVDTIVQADLGKEFAEFELSGKPVGVAPYPSAHAKRFVGNHTAIRPAAYEFLSNPNFNKYASEFPTVLESKGFNAGVMFINLRLWSLHGLTEKYKYLVHLQSSSKVPMFESGNQIYLWMTLCGSKDSRLHFLRPTMNTVLHAGNETKCHDWLGKYGFGPTWSSARDAGVLHWAGKGKPCVASQGPCPSTCLGGLWRGYHSEYEKWLASVSQISEDPSAVNCPLGDKTLILISRSYISYLSGHSIYSWQLATVLLEQCPKLRIVHVINSDVQPESGAICPEIKHPRYRLVLTGGCENPHFAENETDHALRPSSIAATLRSVLKEAKNAVGFIINTLMFLQDVMPVFAEFDVPLIASLRGTDLYVVEDVQQSRYHQALKQLKHIFTMSPFMHQFAERFGITVGSELPTMVADVDPPKLVPYFLQWSNHHNMDVESTVPLLMYIGRLSREKGVVRIARSFATLAQSMSVQIVMGGSGPEEAEVRSELAHISTAIVAPMSYLEVRALAAHARTRRSIFVSEPGIDSGFVEGLGSAYMFFSSEGVPLLFPVNSSGGAIYTCSAENARWAAQFPVQDFEIAIKRYIAGDFAELELPKANLVHAAQHWSTSRVLAPLFKEIGKLR